MMFPLHFTELLNKVDFIAQVEGGGFTGKSGAIRLALSKALCSFVNEDMIPDMRVGKLHSHSIHGQMKAWVNEIQVRKG